MVMPTPLSPLPAWTPQEPIKRTTDIRYVPDRSKWMITQLGENVLLDGSLSLIENKVLSAIMERKGGASIVNIETGSDLGTIIIKRALLSLRAKGYVSMAMKPREE